MAPLTIIFIYPEILTVLMEFVIVLEPAEEGGFTVFVPSLPGCTSEGDTKDEALKNIKEAIALYLEPDTNELVNYSGETVTLTI